MRRLSMRRRCWLRHRAQKRSRRFKRDKTWIQARNAVRARDLAAMLSRKANLPTPEYEEGRWLAPWGNAKEVRLLAPAKLSLGESYASVMSFIEELRCETFHRGRFTTTRARSRRARFLADLSRVQTMSIDAALVVAAEFDRIRRIRKFKPAIDDNRWRPSVRDALDQMGFYELVEAAHKTASAPPAGADFGMKFVRFASGNQVEPDEARQLIERLREAGGDRPEQLALYDVLIEAVMNVCEHAYPDSEPHALVPQVDLWWAGGAYHKSSGRLHISVYDQGLGIPATLPSNSWFQSAVEKFRGEITDADRIEWALNYGKSSLREPGRGNGLWRIVKVAELRPGSNVHIWSGKGGVSYLSTGEVRKAVLKAPFCGTLIHWDLLMANS